MASISSVSAISRWRSPDMARVLIVEARFYDALNDALIEGARDAIEAAGHSHEIVTVPGALEVPGPIAMAAETGRYDAFVALGEIGRASCRERGCPSV